MKKIYFLLLMSFCGMMAMGQDLDDIREMLNKSKFREARTAIDSYLSDAKNANKSDAWYYKGRIYNSLSYENGVPETELYKLRNDAFAAFQKYQQLDQKDVWMKLENYESYLNLYGGLYDLGARQYNNKNYDGAYESFKKAGDVKDYILARKYDYPQMKLYPLDTSLVLNTATSAIQAKKTDEAVMYYRKLTDADVAGKDYEEVYEFLVDHYSKKNDDANLSQMLAKAKKFYPANDYWTDVEVRQVSSTGNKEALHAKYEELMEKNPSNFRIAYNYSVELYNELYGRDAKPSLDNLAPREKLSNVLKKAIAIEKDNEASMLMCNHLFNMAADLLNASNAIKSNKPEEVKKKNDLKAQANKTMDECITYAESSVKYFESLPTMKPVQKANYKIVLGYLSDIYSIKNNPKKSAEYETKNKAADKL